MNKRSINTIYERARRLGCNNGSDYSYWTDDEIDLLKKYYPIEGRKCFRHFPNKTSGAVFCKAKKLKIKIDNPNPCSIKWTEEETNILITNYSQYGARYCAELLNRPIGQITLKASRLNLTCDKFNNKIDKWTDDEYKILNDTYLKGVEVCMKALPNKTRDQIMNKARKFNLVVNKILRYKSKAVICIETDEIFNSVTDAKNKYPQCDISACVHKKQQVSHGLHWAYVDDIDYIRKLSDKKDIKSYTTSKAKAVQCIETGEIFRCCADAHAKYHCDPGEQIRNRRASAGKLPDGTKLHWKYVDEKDSNK